MASDYRLTTSMASLGAAPLPTSGIGQYLNQQIIGTENRAANEARRNAYQPQGFFTRDQKVAVESPTAATSNKVTDTIKTTLGANRKIAGYQAEARRKINERNTANVSSGGGGSYRNTYAVPAGVTGSRAQALQNAASYLGSRYVLGGRSKQGIDCSGLVMMAYNPLGFNISRHSASWQRDNIPGVRTNDIGSLRPGDIVAWRDGSHIAVYAGNGEIIEAANERIGTVRRKIWASSSQLVGIKLRFPGE